MTPLVSVVIPTAQRPALVGRALRSVLGQTHAALDVIVVIDGVDPDTVLALAAFTDVRLRVLQTAEPYGAGAVRNLAAQMARGDWIAFLDDDDEWLPGKIERQLAAADGREVLVSCRSRVVTARGADIWPRRVYDGRMPVDEYLFDRRSLFRGESHIGTSTFLMPAGLFARTGFSTDRQNEDTTLLLRVTKLEGAAILMVPDTLVVLHKEEARASLGNRFDWREMLGWVDGMGPLVTKRAYSGFCLIYLGSQAARRGDLAGFVTLLRRAFARGAPTAMQLLPFFAFWLIPGGLRRWVRMVVRRRAAC
jgi:glycosyltransferase involved in cell wall biosynthesis